MKRYWRRRGSAAAIAYVRQIASIDVLASHTWRSTTYERQREKPSEYMSSVRKKIRFSADSPSVNDTGYNEDERARMSV